MEKEQVEKTITYWLTSADYDLEVSKSLFKKKKYHYSLFFGHLALEMYEWLKKKLKTL